MRICFLNLMKLYILTLLLAITLSANALNITNEAGDLARRVTDRNVTQLAVDGTLDAADCAFIVDSLPGLQTLDLRAATFEGNTLPAFALMGLGATKLILPASITAIDDAALASSAITAIELPSSVKTLGTSVFNSCTALSSVTLPATLAELPAMTFKGCTALKQVSLPASLTNIGTEAFSGCTALASVDLPVALTTVGDRAFLGCNSLTEIKFPASLVSLGDEALAHTGLARCDLSGCRALTSVGSRAFTYCSRLTAARLPEAFSGKIGDGAWSDCPALTEIALPATMTTLSPYMLKDTGIDGTLELPQGTRVIAPYALYSASGITQVIIPATVDSLGEYSLARMSSLEQIDAKALEAIPATGNDAFHLTASSSVTLIVSKEMAGEFSAAPQWNEFKIQEYDNSGVDIPALTAGDLRIRREADALVITSAHPVTRATIHDLSGVMLVTADGHDATEVSIDVSGIASSTPCIITISTTQLNTSVKLIL